MRDDLTSALGMYGTWLEFQQGVWSPVRAKVLAIYANMAKVPGVPVNWLSQVSAEIQTGTGVKPVQTRPYGVLRADLPAWLTQDQVLMDIWDEAAHRVEKAVFEFANGVRLEGLKQMEAAYAWSRTIGAIYDAAVAIRDLPKNAVEATLGGAQEVFLGIAGKVLKSPLFWIAVGGFIAYKAGWFGKAAEAIGKSAAKVV